MSIRKRGKGAYQVRVRPFPARTVPTHEAAVTLELDLKLRKSLGDLYEEPPITLLEAIDGYLERKRSLGGKRGRLRQRSIEFHERSLAVWCRDSEISKTLVPHLRRARIEDVVVRRAAKHPRSAKNELEAIKAVLREARSRGQRIHGGVLEIPPIAHDPRRGRALTVDELDELASWFPEHVKRLVLLAGQIGARQRVWFALTDDLLDLEERALTIPAELAKNRREHRIYLTPSETTLFREQLVARAKHTRLIFPTLTGRPWNRSGFRERAWLKGVTAAAKQDARSKRPTGVFGRIDEEGELVDGLTFHMLRHTAGSLMALAGMDPAIAAERLSHTDGGALFLRTYRHLYEGEKRRQAAKLERLVERERRRAGGE